MSSLNSYSGNSKKHIYLVLAAILGAVVLTVLPVPNLLVWIWPQWLLLAVMYIVFTRSEHYGIVFGFIIGILTDLLIGNQLGIHALTYTCACYFLLKMHQRIAFFPAVQQAFLVFIIVLLDHMAVVALSKVTMTYIYIGHSLLSSISTAVLWIVVVSLFGSKNQLSRMM